MRYLIDTNVVIKLKERNELNIFKDKKTILSKLSIEELLKNIAKNYSRQKALFEFIKESDICIDWRNLRYIINDSFGCDTIQKLDIYIKNEFSSILKFNNNSDYQSDYKERIMENKKRENDVPLDPFEECMKLAAELVKIQNPQSAQFLDQIIPAASEALHKTKLESEFFISNYDLWKKKEFYRGCSCDKIKKLFIHNLVKDYLSLSDIKRSKRRIKEIIKLYNGKIDIYINACVKYLSSDFEWHRNDSYDLKILTYIEKDIIFVTEDRKLLYIVNTVSKNKAINIDSYLSI